MMPLVPIAAGLAVAKIVTSVQKSATATKISEPLSKALNLGKILDVKA